MKVAILTNKAGWRRGNFDYFPLFKWHREIRAAGIEIAFFKSHTHPKIVDYKNVIVDFRYYRNLIGFHPDADKRLIIDFIHECRDRGQFVTLHDSSDSSGSREFDLINCVDRYLKKQVFKDKSKYLSLGQGLQGYMPWLPKGEFGIKDDYAPCPESELHKISLSWNIGFCDYRQIPLLNKLRLGSSRVFPSFGKLKFVDPKSPREFTTVFRGGVGSRGDYAYQRRKVIEQLEIAKNLENIVVGGRVSKREYLFELMNSKLSISPFGWGEVCYRDFESIMAGAALIKPDMRHLETYPDIFRDGETYHAIPWEMDSLIDGIHELLRDDGRRLSLACRAQDFYRSTVNDVAGFVERFKQIVAF